MQYGDSFLVIGGLLSNTETSDKIYRYNTVTDEWDVLDARLSVPRAYIQGFLVPDDYLPCDSDI